MGDDITIGVTEIINNIEVTAQPNDQIVEIDVVDNSDDVTLNITPTVIEININKGSSFARWGDILGNLPDQEDLQNVLNLKADLVGGLVPASQLPSYVDDIIEVANYAALPTTGEVGKIYVTLDNNKIFRWSGSVYIEIAANTAVWGAITGTLSSQTDLQTALDTKALKTITITPSAPLSGGGDLSANRTISISQSNATTDGYLSSIDWNTFNNKQYALNGTGFVKISGTTISYDNSTYVPTSRTLTINGTAYDLSTNRSWTIPTHDAVTIGTPANGLSLSGQVLSLSVAHSLNTGALSSTDWTTFNNKIGGSGTINYLPKFTSSGAIGNSNILDNGSYVEILTGAIISGNLNVNGVVSSGTPSNSLSIISNSGAIFVKNSASNTAYAFQLNTSSGLDLWSTNSGGTSTRRMTLDSSGNLGIGTTSPNYSSSGRTVVDINGTSQSMLALSVGGVGKSFLFYTGTDLLVSNESNGAIKFNTNGSEKAIITSGGNVGIGTTSPGQKLVVDGGASDFTPIFAKSSLLSGGKYFGSLLAGYATTTNQSVQFGYVYNSTTIADSFAHITTFGASEGSQFAMKPNGNVGIGTTSPSEKLSVIGGNIQLGAGYKLQYSSTAYMTPENNVSGAEIATGGIFTIKTGGTTERVRVDASGNVGIGTTSPAEILHLQSSQPVIRYTKTGILNWKVGVISGNTFTINNDSSGGDVLNITSGGNVGIGTTSPTLNKLQVIGSIGGTTQGTLGSSKTGALIGYSNSDTNKYTQIGYDATGNYGWIQCIQEGVAYRNLILNGNGGNVGIGETSPSEKLTIASGNIKLNSFQSTSGDYRYIGTEFATNNGNNKAEIRFAIDGSDTYTRLQFHTANGAGNIGERMRITSSGVVCVGTTSGFDSGLVCSDGGSSYVPYTAKIGTTASSTQMFFRNPNGVVGSISTSGSLTSFNVTSDYRLKQDFKPFNGLDLVSKIKVYDYEWKADNSRMNGVIAHELQEVIPYAVTGEKDAEQMQSVDYSKLVPILVQAIQELNDKINKLENK